MIDHLLGRPNPSWKRAQVFFVIFFWLWRILYGDPQGPRILWIRRVNRLLKRFSPWQLVVSTLTGVYAVRNLDKIVGLGSPEPLARLYSPSYYRATWISTGLDAGFATAMSIRPKWLRDFCSILFSIYYIIYATEADEKLRRFRAVPTVEMLRATWEKTTNPYLQAISFLPRVSIRRKLSLPRPNDSTYQRPITAWLFFAPPEHHLARATELILDFPGGGFISMTPEHHEDRLRMWAIRTGKPILSIDYGKAPEYPYPFAIDECFDVYRTLVASAGKIIGMSGSKFDVIFTGDSAGAHVAVAVMIKILETQIPVPHPLALQLNYAALDFNFTSWMSPQNLRVLQSEQSSGHLSGLAEQKDHFKHISPLSMVGDRKAVRRRRSWKDALRDLTSPVSERPTGNGLKRRTVAPSIKATQSAPAKSHARTYFNHNLSSTALDEAGSLADEEDGAELSAVAEEDKPIQARVRFNPVVSQVEVQTPQKELSGQSVSSQTDGDVLPLGTRLTMTSRTGYFQDRIISPSMMRAMAILFIGPHRNPEFQSDYHLSPVLTPSHLLARFPPLLMTCGEKDPFVDDTVIFAGRVREAKRARRAELDLALSVKSAKFGEHLRMSMHDSGCGRDDASLRAMKHELDELASQAEEDWVQMHIFSEWSHGYMQMSRLMQEAHTVINDVADWMDEVFEGRRGRSASRGRRSAWERRLASEQRRAAAASTSASLAAMHTDDGSTPFASETEMEETETDDPLTFAPKKRSPPNSFSSAREQAAAVQLASPPRSQPRQSSKGTSSRRQAHGNGSALDAKDMASANGLDPPLEPMTVASQDILHGAGITLQQYPAQANGSVAKQVSSISHHQRLPSPPGGKAGSPGGKAGQKISESELMRRRRLLDSHLITSDSNSSTLSSK